MDHRQTYYDILEVTPSADMAEIKSAYRRLARKYHPDINPGNPIAESKFKQVGEAYAVLSEPEKRQAYDLSFGIRRKTSTDKNTQAQSTSTREPASGGRAKNAKAPPPPRTKTSAGSSTKQTSADAGDGKNAGFKDMFDSLFRKDERADGNTAASSGPEPSAVRDAQRAYSAANKAASSKPVRGEDVTVETVISRNESQQGIVKTVSVQHTEACKRCSATGKVNGLPCSVCHGDKQLVTVRKIDVRIPAGVKAGSKVRVAKEGGRGLQGGEPGDLFLLIKIEEEQALKIDGLTVTCDVPITIPEAVLGAEIDVPTLHGKVKMVIPALTNSGTVFRLKGQGVKLNNNTGDQFVTVYIVSPKSLSAREKELYQELARVSTDAPRK